MVVVLIVLVLPSGLFNITAKAASSGTYGNCNWELNGTVLTISPNRSGDCGMTDFTYSPTISYNYGTPWGTNMTEIIIKERITYIGDAAFVGCKSLKRVTIENGGSVSVGDGAFKHCSKLEEFSGSVTYLGRQAFYDCPKLTALDLSNAGQIYVDACSNSGLTTITLAKNAEIFDRAFYGCSNLKTVTLNGDCKIYVEAFKNCGGLTNLNLNGNCSSGVSHGTYSSAESYDPGWNHLKNVTVGQSTTNIGNYLFANCYNLKNISLHNKITVIGVCAFLNSGLTEITIPNSVTEIKNNAFTSCSSLASVTMPNSVPKISESAFASCNNLNKLNISDLESWCKMDFSNAAANPLYYAKNLYLNNTLVTNLTIPSSVTKLNGYVFAGCSSITSVTIPNSVTSIGYGTFKGCSNIQKITIPFVGEQFNGNSNTSFGTIFGVDNSSVPSQLKEVTITGGVSIDNEAFKNCSNIEKVVITGGIKSIYRAAFSNCKNLKTIYLPSDVKYIYDFNFYVDDNSIVFSKCDLLTIECEVGSLAEEYAKQKNYDYKSHCNQTSHVFEEWKLTKKSTCTSDGLQTRECSDCHYVEEKIISATGHRFIGSWTVTKKSTCETTGEKTRYCLNCKVSEIEIIDKLEHSFSDPIITKKPTCTEFGVETGICSLCKEETTNSIPPTGHTLENAVVTLEPTCTTDGKKEGKCTICGTTDGVVIIPANGHTYGEAVITKEATESEMGIKTSICNICGEVKEDVITYNANLTTDETDSNDSIVWLFVALGVVVLISGITIILLVKKKK